MLRCPKCQSELLNVIVSNVSLILRQSEKGSLVITRNSIEDIILINDQCYDDSAPILPIKSNWEGEAEFELVNKGANIKDVRVVCQGECEGTERSLSIEECLSQEERVAKRDW